LGVMCKLIFFVAAGGFCLTHIDAVFSYILFRQSLEL